MNLVLFFFWFVVQLTAVLLWDSVLAGWPWFAIFAPTWVPIVLAGSAEIMLVVIETDGDSCD
jgi:hypothetical protein